MAGVRDRRHQRRGAHPHARGTADGRAGGGCADTARMHEIGRKVAAAARGIAEKYYGNRT